MTNNEINKAIATHIFGFEDYDMLLSFSGAPERKLYGATKFANNWTPVPDYCNDLNEMYEAEELFYAKADTLEGAERMRDYSKWLCCLTKYPLHATASQRAEAFLKTIGK